MILYHATQNKNLTIIEPQPTLSLDKYIGDFVFATKIKNMALMYLVPHGFPTLMNPNDKEPNIVISANPVHFKSKDKGGAIYELPSESFIDTPQKGLSEFEMVSTKAVEPISKQVITSTLHALTNAGISIHFVNEKTFNKLIEDPNQQRSIKLLPKFNLPYGEADLQRHLK